MNRQKSKSTFSTTLLALMLALILGGAGFLGSPAWAAEPQYGGSITFLDGYGGRFPPTQWDPAKGVWTVGVYVEPYYETLLATDFVKNGPRGTNEYPSYHSQGAIEELLTGRLAESWSVPDETTLIFKLREGIMWQAKPGVMESRELTAEDVAYSFTFGRYEHRQDVGGNGSQSQLRISTRLKSRWKVS